MSRTTEGSVSFALNATQGQIYFFNFSLLNLVKYTITFTESRLPSGTAWYVNLTNGNPYSSSSNSITFKEPNGSYSFTVATSNKSYAPSPYSGSFKVNGRAIPESISFSLITYTIEDSE